MKIQIRRAERSGDTSSSGLWTVLTSGLFARRWLGRTAPRVPTLLLPSGRHTLLYFRTRGCTVCDLIDMKVAAACSQEGVELMIIDRYAKSDNPKDKEIYTQPGNVLDVGGAINTAYQVGVYPSLILIDRSGHIVMKDVGTQAAPEQFDSYLRTQFGALLTG